ncbi:hypothetical protein BCR44DRAFT_1034621 [Catenaria anguillulae PL171]|uniref:EKC/KEOPS complex subunit GON7 n=1 Tax=Catenaria anguillulae PL171 TaxID=765915 RepID=A0A1Y2HSF5_9FUNG|nr:hypothetical protein BCR44DRAFT_1034621 [Catenaria anguillulae PL171]
MSSAPITLSATFTSSASPDTSPTLLASAQVAAPAANANIMHAFIPALAQLQADINTQLTALLHLDAQSSSAAGNSKVNSKDRQGGDDEDQEEEEVEDQEDDIDDKHTLPAGALGAPDARAFPSATHKRPRLD